MVYYCCVKGCRNNSNDKKKKSSTLSFHAFPSNLDLRMKWLHAIGRPNWDPPSHVRICSVHFSDDQINNDGLRTRILDNACPVNELPPNSYLDASHVEVCRICLDTDVKMYSLQDGVLNTCMETIFGFNESYDIEGLPQFICYKCAAQLMKSYRLIEKSMVAQAILLDIFAQNGEITKTLVQRQNRKELNLESSLISHKITPTTVYKFKYDKEQNFSRHISEKLNYDRQEKYYQITHKNFKMEDDSEEMDVFNDNSGEIRNDVIKKPCKVEETYGDVNDEQIVVVVVGSEDDDDDDNIEGEVISNHNEDISLNGKENANREIFVLEQVTDKEQKVENETRIISAKNTDVIKTGKRPVRKGVDGLTPDEEKMQEHFDIVKLSMPKQIEEWKKSMKRLVKSPKYVHECEICSKMFTKLDTYRNHIAGHDLSRGKATCPVCKLRFKSEASARSHAKYIHEKQFHCKTCARVLNGVPMAKNHQKWHSGHMYVCGECAFSSRFAAALALHARRMHPCALACALCGYAARTTKGLRMHKVIAHRARTETEEQEVLKQEFKCEECDLSFISEGARRLHFLTSKQHRSKLNPRKPCDPTLVNACKTCGEQFPSRDELVAHRRATHPTYVRKSGQTWCIPEEEYPKPCELCKVPINNRREHWAHVRRAHPNERDSYQTVVTAVCDTCGKGCQNMAKLHLHKLRHKSPTVRCEICPKLFYDKYQLAIHVSTHSDARPHHCRECGRGFKLRGNLERHYRIHSDVARYECTICGKKFKYSTSLNLHVRSMHYKIPLPPRKKRSKTKNVPNE